MTTICEQQRANPPYMFVVEPGADSAGNTFTFRYSQRVQGGLNDLTQHSDDGARELIGSAVPILPLEVGKSALLAVNHVDKSTSVMETAPVVHTWSGDG